MAKWKNPCQQIAISKLLFFTFHITIIFGIIVSSFYILSTVYSPDAAISSALSSASTIFLDVDSSSRSAAGGGDGGRAGGNFSRSSAKVGLKPGTVSKTSRDGLRPIWEAPSRKEKIPPLKTFRLTKELVQQRAKDNVIIVTFGNYAFMEFILNWVKHLTDLGLSNLLVGAMDTKLLEALYWKGIPVFDMETHMSTVDLGWGTSSFHKMGRDKVILIDSFLPFDVELLMSDTDVVWIKNPLPYLARFPEADILTSTDQVAPTVTGDRLDIWQEASSAYNIGIFHWRPTEASKKLAKEWKELLLADEKIWDQNGFNDLLRKKLGPSVDDDSGLVYAYDGNLKLGVLPASIFCNGHTYFVQHMYQELKLEPYAVHTIFQYSGARGKRHRLREAMLFYDPPEYYHSSGGFLSFQPFIPRRLLLDGKHNIESHFLLVNYQIKQIRTALAITSLLNRTLDGSSWVLEVDIREVIKGVTVVRSTEAIDASRLDRLFFPHPGVLEGSMTRQPFICPMDHVFAVDTMLEKLPEEEFGQQIDFREYSFFDNPALPSEVKESWLDVQLCRPGSKGCHISNHTNLPGILRFPKRSSEEMFEEVFSLLKDVKVINFLSMEDAFLGYADKERERRFRNRVKRYLGLWCCVDRHPGHIYYDMYWDEKPGWKPIPPQKPEDDHPPW